MLWLQKWTCNLKCLVKEQAVPKGRARRPLEKRLRTEERLENRRGDWECLKLWQAISAINQAFDDAEGIRIKDDVVDTAKEESVSVRKTVPKKSRTRLRTLDFGQPITDVQKVFEKVGMNNSIEVRFWMF